MPLTWSGAVVKRTILQSLVNPLPPLLPWWCQYRVISTGQVVKLVPPSLPWQMWWLDPTEQMFLSVICFPGRMLWQTLLLIPFWIEAFKVVSINSPVELDFQPLMVRSAPARCSGTSLGKQTIPVYWNLDITAASDSFSNVKSKLLPLIVLYLGCWMMAWTWTICSPSPLTL